MFFSVSVSFFAYNSIRVQQTNININDQVAGGSSNQIFAIQSKAITRIHDTKKFPKTNIQVIIYC